MQSNDVLSKAPVTLTLEKSLSSNKVLRNTYMLLAMTLIRC